MSTICEVFSIATTFPIIDDQVVGDGITEAYAFVDSMDVIYTAPGAISCTRGGGDPVPGVVFVVDSLAPVDQSIRTTAAATLPYMYDTISHMLPPITKTATPSLDVLNLAKVGSLQIGDILPPPTNTVGEMGDVAGMVRFDAEKGMWYCVSDYDGENDIWKALSFDGPPYPVVQFGPIGYHTTYKLVGSPSDRVGEIKRLGDGLFICVMQYNGTTPIWKQVTHGMFDTSKFETTYDYPYTTTSDLTNYPTGKMATGFSASIKHLPNRSIVTSGQSLHPAWRWAVYAITPTSNAYSMTMTDYGYNYAAGWCCTIINLHASYTIVVTPYGGSGNTIDGKTSLTIPPKTSTDIIWTGTTFVTAARPKNTTMVTLTPGTTVAVDASLSTSFSLTMGGNYTLSNPTNLAHGDVLTFKIYQSGSTARTLSFGSMYKWAGGTVPTVSVGTGKIDIIRATYDSSNSQLYCEIIKDIR